MKTARYRWLLAATTFSTLAAAQAPKPAPSAPAAAAPRPAGPTQPAGATAAPSATNAATGQDPQLPNIEDPMLVPAPSAPHVLGNWREALGILRANSPNLRTALAQVD